jgi:hypothetical protein
MNHRVNRIEVDELKEHTYNVLDHHGHQTKAPGVCTLIFNDIDVLYNIYVF